MHANASATLKRLWTMLRLVPAWPQGITISAMRAALRLRRFDPGRTTVERDLKTLARDFKFIVDTSGKAHRWSWPKKAAIEMLPRPTVSQCLALVLVKQHLGDLLPRWMRDDLVPVFDAAERELETTEWKHWPRLTAVAPVTFALQPPKTDPKVLFDAQCATTRRVILTANYQSIGAAGPKQRTIHPLGMLTRGTVHYLIALLPEHGDQPRQLALHRMSATKVGTEACKSLYGFSMDRYKRGLAIDPRGKIRVRLHFRGTSADHLLGTPISKYQSWNPIPGAKKVEVCGTVEDDREFWRWVLSFGSEVEVMEPAHLREEMVAEVRKMAEAYGIL